MNLAAEIKAFVVAKLQNLFDKYPILKKKYTIPAILGILGLIFFVYGLIMLFTSDSSNDEVSFQKAEAVSADSKVENKIVVDIEGAVVKPGIYHLEQNSRIQDLLIMSGGLSAEADRIYVAKNMNLATKLIDGGKVYVPSLEERVEQSNGSRESSTTGLININTASEKELDSLPGVGLVTVSKIVANRPYQSLDQLTSKKIVSKKVFENIKSKITF